MSDFELRKILRDVMDDLDRGRLRLQSRVARGVVLPAAMVAGLGLAGLGLAACDTSSVGNAQDARPDVQNIVDAAYMAPDVALDAVALDAVAPAYMGPIVDGGVDAEAVTDADVDEDADIVDSGPHTLYMGPPPIDPE
jgi:hypothetical protein